MQNFNFTDVYEHAAEIGANGVIGLGPGDEESYVRQLLANGSIDRGYASLDLQKSED